MAILGEQIANAFQPGKRKTLVAGVKLQLICYQETSPTPTHSEKVVDASLIAVVVMTLSTA